MSGHYAIVLGMVNRYSYRINKHWKTICTDSKESELRLRIMNLKNRTLVEFDDVFLRYEEVWKGNLPFGMLEIGDEIIVSKDTTHRIVDATRHVDGSVIYETDTVSHVEYTKESEEEKAFYNKMVEIHQEKLKETEKELEELLTKKSTNIFRRLLNKFK